MEDVQFNARFCTALIWMDFKPSILAFGHPDLWVSLFDLRPYSRLRSSFNSRPIRYLRFDLDMDILNVYGTASWDYVSGSMLPSGP